MVQEKTKKTCAAIALAVVAGAVSTQTLAHKTAVAQAVAQQESKTAQAPSEDDIRDANELIERLQDENRALRREIEEKDSQIAKTEKELKDAKEKAKSAEDEAKKSKDAADEAKARADALETQAQQAQEAQSEASVAATSPEQVQGDVADLVIGQEDVDVWAAKIDRYLAGTALDGYGHTFAQAAADYGVDPRLSPAISVIESSAGAYLAAPHNAWGWGGPGNWSSWNSWEEAIVAHTRGLAEGGYMPFDRAAGTRYCDSTYWDYLKPLIEQVGAA